MTKGSSCSLEIRDHVALACHDALKDDPPNAFQVSPQHTMIIRLGPYARISELENFCTHINMHILGSIQ